MDITQQYDESDIWMYLVMEWLEGKSLKQYQAQQLQSQGSEALDWAQIKFWLPGIGAGLSYAHSQGVIHRDIKPANIFVEPDGRVVILDFGIARVMNDTLTQAGAQSVTTTGSSEYMPPESFIGGHKAQEQDDVYGLAVTIYELLTGDHPFMAALAVVRTASYPMPAQPEQLTEAEWVVLQAGLEADASERPEAIGPWVEDLLEAQAKAEEEIQAQAKLEAKRQAEQAVLEQQQRAKEEKRAEEERQGLEVRRQQEAKKKQEAAVRQQAERKKQQAWARSPGSEFSDYEGGPEMVVIPAGSYQMGSPLNEKDRGDGQVPMHHVTIPKPFAVSKYTVTFDQWDAFVGESSCPAEARADDGGWGRGSRPVINVSWHDAQAYVEWLSKKTGKAYRLLTESEWVEDCWHDSYSGAPADGSAWTSSNSGDCNVAVVRGGSWNNYSPVLRAAKRGFVKRDEWSNTTGFRVAQD